MLMNRQAGFQRNVIEVLHNVMNNLFSNTLLLYNDVEADHKLDKTLSTIVESILTKLGIPEGVDSLVNDETVYTAIDSGAVHWRSVALAMYLLTHICNTWTDWAQTARRSLVKASLEAQSKLDSTKYQSESDSTQPTARFLGALDGQVWYKRLWHLALSSMHAENMVLRSYGTAWLTQLLQDAVQAQQHQLLASSTYFHLHRRIALPADVTALVEAPWLHKLVAKLVRENHTEASHSADGTTTGSQHSLQSFAVALGLRFFTRPYTQHGMTFTTKFLTGSSQHHLHLVHLFAVTSGLPNAMQLVDAILHFPDQHVSEQQLYIHTCSEAFGGILHYIATQSLSSDKAVDQTVAELRQLWDTVLPILATTPSTMLHYWSSALQASALTLPQEAWVVLLRLTGEYLESVIQMMIAPVADEAVTGSDSHLHPENLSQVDSTAVTAAPVDGMSTSTGTASGRVGFTAAERGLTLGQQLIRLASFDIHRRCMGTHQDKVSEELAQEIQRWLRILLLPSLVTSRYEAVRKATGTALGEVLCCIKSLSSGLQALGGEVAAELTETAVTEQLMRLCRLPEYFEAVRTVDVADIQSTWCVPACETSLYTIHALMATTPLRHEHPVVICLLPLLVAIQHHANPETANMAAKVFLEVAMTLRIELTPGTVTLTPSLQAVLKPAGGQADGTSASVIPATMAADELVTAIFERFKPVKLWQQRRTMLQLLSYLGSTNTFILSTATRKRFLDVVTVLLKDKESEVQDAAKSALIGFMMTANDAFQQAAAADYLKLAAGRARTKPARPAGNATDEEKQAYDDALKRYQRLQRKRNAGCLGLAAIILAHPFDVPDWLPELLAALGRRASDPNPVRKTVQETFGHFKRTHQVCVYSIPDHTILYSTARYHTIPCHPITLMTHHRPSARESG